MNPIAWITNPINARMRQKQLDEFLQQHTPKGQQPTTAKATVIYNDHALMAMTYRNAAEARDRMHIDFNVSITSVTSALAAVADSFGFGQTQQDFAFYWLSRNNVFDHEQRRRATANRVANGNSTWRKRLVLVLSSRVENDN